jgi:hypothetical protein
MLHFYMLEFQREHAIAACLLEFQRVRAFAAWHSNI